MSYYDLKLLKRPKLNLMYCDASVAMARRRCENQAVTAGCVLQLLQLPPIAAAIVDVNDGIV